MSEIEGSLSYIVDQFLIRAFDFLRIRQAKGMNNIILG